jgi:hypothetical protein
MANRIILGVAALLLILLLAANLKHYSSIRADASAMAKQVFDAEQLALRSQAALDACVQERDRERRESKAMSDRLVAAGERDQRESEAMRVRIEAELNSVSSALQLAQAKLEELSRKGRPPESGRNEIPSTERWASIEGLTEGCSYDEAKTRMNRHADHLLKWNGEEWDLEGWESILYPKFGTQRSQWPEVLRGLQSFLSNVRQKRIPRECSYDEVGESTIYLWHLEGGSTGCFVSISGKLCGSREWERGWGVRVAVEGFPVSVGQPSTAHP